MPSDLRLDTSLGADQRLTQLLAQQADIEAQNARIQAEIAALIPPSSPPSHQHPRSPIYKHRHRRSANTSRALSSSGTTMARQLSDRSEVSAPRSRTLSQRSAPAPSMARMNSRGASSESSGNLGFAQIAAMPPPFPAESREQLAMETWMKDQPLTSYTFSHQPPRPQRSVSQRGYPLEQVNELEDVGENPHDFLSRTVGTPTLTFAEYSAPTSTSLDDSRLTASSFAGATPTTPTTDSLTIATTLQSSMSRQSSIGNEPVLESFQMMKVNSNASYFTDINSSDQIMFDVVNAPYTPLQHRRPSREEQKQLLAGLGGAGNDSEFSPSFPSTDTFISPTFGEKMEKSPSIESTSSTSSSRSKQRLLATVAAARPLKPRGGSGESDMSRTSSFLSASRLELIDGSQDKVAIPKPTYQRPKHERVFCKQCDSNSDGFRGEHELRRHQDREHRPMVKKWVCIEPATPGHPKPVSSLSKCKACCQQKKYGAYYNAAAHLRRTHFNPKAKGRNKAKGDGGEKRAGKGGGDWPAMPELKFWMKEVEEPAAEYPPTASQEDDVDADADASDDTPLHNDYDDEVLTTEQTLHESNLEDSFLASTPLMPSIYASTNNDFYAPHDLASEQGSFADSSMYGSNNFHFSPNDAMAFFDSSLPQAFDDQASAGLDFSAVNFPYQ